MRAELDAIAQRLRAASSNAAGAFLVSADAETVPPYWVLEPIDAPDELRDRRLTASDPSLAFHLRLKSVGSTGAKALNLAAMGKADLSPDGAPKTVTVTGRRVEVTHERFEAAYPDESVTLAGLKGHPAVVVETYTVTSHPA